MADPNAQIRIITKPGGLTGTEHAVHILICVCSGGLWVPGYILFAVMAPKQRFEVQAPYGTDPQAIARARMEAESQAQPQAWYLNSGIMLALATGLTVLSIVACCTFVSLR